MSASTNTVSSHGPIEIVPSVWDIASAKLAKEAGAKMLFLSGGSLSSNLGLPDRGLMTTDYLVNLSRDIVKQTGLELYIDGEAGFGEGPVLAWFAERLLDAGVTGLMIEDQEYSGQAYTHTPGLCSPEEMVRRIEVIRGATDGKLKIMARTDVISKTAPFEESLARLRAYRDAGADWLMAIDVRSKDELGQVAELIDGNLLAVGRSGFGYLPSLDDAREVGCKAYMVMYHQRMVLTFLLERYKKTMEGNVDEIYANLLSSQEVSRIMGFERYTRWERANWKH